MQRWTIYFSSKAVRQYRKLPESVKTRVDALIIEIGGSGPIRGNWKNYGKITKGTRHHCHLKSGRPTYVACWEVVKEKIRIVEIYYVGTHEKAPY